MLQLRLFCISALFTVACVHTIRAQWVQVGDAPFSIANHGNIVGHDGLLFASNDLTGVVRSTDNGLSWEDITNGVQDASAMCYHGSYLFVGTLNGIHRSANDGDTWEAATTGISLSSTNWVRRYRNIGGQLYVVLSGDVNEDGGIYRSNDHGDTWTACNAGLSFPTTTVTDLVEKGGRLYCTNGNAVHVSDDGGDSWTATHNWQTTTIDGKALGVSGDRLIVSMTGFGNMKYSDNDGATWTTATCSSMGSVYSSIENFGGYLFALQYGNVCRSTDGGLTWPIYEGGFNANTPVRLSPANGDLYCPAGIWLYRLDGTTGLSGTTPPLLDIRYADGLLRVVRATPEPWTVRITDAFGRVVLERRLSADVDQLPFDPAPGQYCAQLISAHGGSVVKRFVATR